MAEEWYPGAVRRAGPEGKFYPDVNANEGVILHSAQGSIAGALSVLDDITGSATSWRAASWTFTVQQNGIVLQHYPLSASPFHAGGKHWNTRLVGIEHEGGPPGNLSEPLTPHQLDASKALVAWVAEQGGWTPRLDLLPTLWAHSAVTQTQCPSGRIPWGEYLPAASTGEEEVQTEPMSQGETIAAANRIFERFGAIIADNAGETCERVTLPPPPAGYQRVVITYKEG